MAVLSSDRVGCPHGCAVARRVSPDREGSGIDRPHLKPAADGFGLPFVGKAPCAFLHWSPKEQRPCWKKRQGCGAADDMARYCVADEGRGQPTQGVTT